MRYQTYVYENRVSRPAEIIEAPDRRAALAANREAHGRDAGGVQALDVGCSWCEDKPVPNAERWVSLTAPATAPCPRCGKGGDDAGE